MRLLNEKDESSERNFRFSKKIADLLSAKKISLSRIYSAGDPSGN